MGVTRCPEQLLDLVLPLSKCVASWVQNLQEGYQDDIDANKLLTKLSVSGSNDKGYTLVDDTIRYKGHVWVGNNQLAQQHILIAFHDSGLGGHFGIIATYHRVRQLFAWPGLKQIVQLFVQ